VERVVSVDEQHRATQRARNHRDKAERLLSELPADAVGVGLAAIVHLLLAIEDRLTYGHQSMLDGTISCRICRVILLEGNSDRHYDWHARLGEHP
jgi:hypothetical protein